jgi:hypothetical protein
MLMFAYGSNLNARGMANRCPAAKRLGWMMLRDWRLIFRGAADCVRESGAVCYGGLWRITPACEQVLDRYEGVASGVYRKEQVPSENAPALIYCMNSTGIVPPSEEYLKVIEEGYLDFHMPAEAFQLLRDAVQASWDNKAPSHMERRRYQHEGRGRGLRCRWHGSRALPAAASRSDPAWSCSKRSTNQPGKDDRPDAEVLPCYRSAQLALLRPT